MSQGNIHALATTTEGERMTVYAGLGSGVHRLTTRPLNQRVYLPIVLRNN
jgi:hypothetical protein